MSTSYPVPHEDKVLRLLTRLYALRNDQICRRFYAGASIEHVREITASLVKRGYLQADTQPKKIAVGRSPVYFRLTTKASQYLADNGADIAIPKRGSDPAPGFLFLDHLFSLNDFFIDLELLTERVAGVRIEEFRHERELKREPDSVVIRNGKEDISVRYHADGWVKLFVGEHEHCIALELDRGTEEQKRWRHKVRMILAWARGPYLTRFSPDFLTVAVVAVPGTKRMGDLLHWTELELRLANREDDGQLFLFTDRDPGQIDPIDLAAEPVWIEPFTRMTHSLLTGVERPNT